VERNRVLLLQGLELRLLGREAVFLVPFQSLDFPGLCLVCNFWFRCLVESCFETIPTC
jgi:hypothetical protein